MLHTQVFIPKKYIIINRHYSWMQKSICKPPEITLLFNIQSPNKKNKFDSLPFCLVLSYNMYGIVAPLKILPTIQHSIIMEQHNCKIFFKKLKLSMSGCCYYSQIKYPHMDGSYKIFDSSFYLLNNCIDITLLFQTHWNCQQVMCSGNISLQA